MAAVSQLVRQSQHIVAFAGKIEQQVRMSSGADRRVGRENGF
jgi:hypothetical protein